MNHETCVGLRKGPMNHPLRQAFACLDCEVWGEMPPMYLLNAPNWTEADYMEWTGKF